ncbi:MAG TPA: GDSL-type esterase/lipase family protein [Candidatus Limnocylindria bacterium]|nr:GDSL-type esterase/lipase family protein [Candidatus Limnocylindria bacterium]
MTRLIFALALALVSCTATPVTVVTATPRPTTTPTLFVTTTAPTTSPSTVAPAFRYVAIGASDTVGVGASDPRAGSWPARVAARLAAGTDYVNLGVSGSLAAQAAREQLPTALGLQPQLVTIWLAVNDLNASVSPSDYAIALRSVIEPLVSRSGTRIFVGTVPDLRSVPAYAGTDPAALLARITAYNTAIAAIAASFSGRVVAVDLFTGSGPLVSTITVSADGFHPSDAGYALIADRFAKAIADAGIALR